MGACQRATTQTVVTASIIPSIGGTEVTRNTDTPTQPAYPAPTVPNVVPPTTSIAYPAPLPTTPTTPSASLVASPTQAGRSPTITNTSSIPTSYTASPTQQTPTAGATSYPGPPATAILPTLLTQGAYPGPSTPSPAATRTPRRTNTATPPSIPGVTSSPTPTRATSTPGPSPTERPPQPPSSPPPPGSVVTIWHSWDEVETEALVTVIRSFQDLYPSVVFDVSFVPLDDLRSTYEAAVYYGYGPSLLLGPADWGPAFYDSNLVADLSAYAPPDFLTQINPAALASGQYHGALVSLPLSQKGVVIFRNESLIHTAPATFDELIEAARDATRGGNIGSYLERSAFFSGAGINGLGGHLMDSDYNPTFDDSFGLEWFDLLTAYDDAGAVTFNTDRDLNMFMQGRVGLIIDGSWNISALSQAIGSDNLAIDPWPTYGSGHLSGWVQSNSVYLNINTYGDNRFAALSFMGYLLDPNVQMVMAEAGHIPSVITTQPRNILYQQAMVAFSKGISYPIVSDNRILIAYWDELDLAIQSVFERGIDPASAIQAARDAITQRLEDIRGEP